MAMTGHKSFKAFFSYIRVTQEEHVSLIEKHYEEQEKKKEKK